MSSLVLKVALVPLLPPVPLVLASFVSSVIYWGFKESGKGKQSRPSHPPPPTNLPISLQAGLIGIGATWHKPIWISGQNILEL